MKYLFNSVNLILLILVSSNCQRTAETEPFDSYWQVLPDRVWVGPEYWANRLQDWHIREGRLECINGALPKRTLHLLTHFLTERPGSLQMQVETDLIRKVTQEDDQVYSGFLICAGSEDMDYRKRAIIHGTHGNLGGIIAALNLEGDLVLVDNETNETIAGTESATVFTPAQFKNLRLSLQLIPKGEEYQIIFVAGSAQGETEYNRLEMVIPKSEIPGGNLALVASGGQFGFSNWKVRGTKVKYEEDQQFGPIIGTQYTLSDNVLKLTAQLPPISESDEPEVELQVMNRKTG